MDERPIDADNHYDEPLDAFTGTWTRPAATAVCARSRTASGWSCSSAAR
jgi:hypothetical protein